MVDDAGSETKGTVFAVSESDLTLEVNDVRRSISAGSVREIQRYGDSPWNGFLIGSAVGASAAIMSDAAGSTPCQDDPQKPCADINVGQRVLAVVLMGALGAGIDALIRGRHDVYVAPGPGSGPAARVTVVPHFAPTRAGVVVMVRLKK